MTSKKSKVKRHFTPKPAPESSASPAIAIKGMSSYNASNPPTGPRFGSSYHPSPPRGPRRYERDDGDPYRRRSRSRSRSRSPRRIISPRRRGRGPSRDRRRFPYENNYRPSRTSRSPPRSADRRPPLENRADSNRSSATKSPSEERGARKIFISPSREKPSVPPVVALAKAQPPAVEVEDPVSKPSTVIMATPITRPEPTEQAVVMEPPRQVPPPPPPELPKQVQPPPPASDAVQTPVQQTEETPQAELDKIIEDKLMLLVEDCTVMSSLKLQQATAKRKFKRVHADREKFKGHHAKFPATKESQDFAVGEAEKAYKQACDAVQKQEASLRKLAIEMASSIVPSILSSGQFGSSADNKEIAGLNKTCEGFAKLLEEQKKFISNQQQINHRLEEKCQKLSDNFEELEKKHSQLAQNYEKENSAMKEELKTLKSDTTLQLQGFSKKVAETESTIQSLKNSIAEVKKSAASKGNTPEPTKVDQRLAGLEKSYASQLNEISGVKSHLTKLDSSSAEIKIDALALKKKCDQTDAECKATAKTLANQAETQKGLTLRISQAEQKAGQTEVALAARINNLEKKANLPAPVFKPDYTELIKTEIGPLKEKLSELTKAQNQAANAEKSYHHDAFVSLQQDVVKLSGDVKMLKAPSSVATSTSASASSTNNSKSRVDNVTTPNGQTTKVGDNLLDKRVTSIEKSIGTQESSFNTELASIKERLNNIEQQPVVQTPVAAPAPQQLPSNVESRLDSLHNDLEQLRGQFDGLPEDMALVVNGAVKAETTSLHKLQKDNTDSLRTSIETLKSDHETLRQETTTAIANVVANVTNGASVAATRDVLNHIHVNNVYAPAQHVNNSLQALHSEIGAHAQSIENLMSRFENINTGQMHAVICDTVKNNIMQDLPNLRDSEARIASLQTSVAVLQAVEPKLVELEKMVNERNGSGTAQGDPGMRTEIDNIIQEASKTQALQKQMAEELKELDSTVKSNEKTTTNYFEKYFDKISDVEEGLKAVRGEADVEKTTLASQGEKLEKLESQVEKLENTTLAKQVEKLESQAGNLEKANEERSLRDKTTDAQLEKLEKANVERDLKEESTEARVDKLEKANDERSLKDKTTDAQLEKLEKANAERILKDQTTEAQVKKLEKANVERSLKERSSVTPAPARAEPSSRHISPAGSFSSVNKSKPRAPRPGSYPVTTAVRPPSSGNDRNRNVSQGTKRQHKSNGTPNGRHSNGTGSPAHKRRRRDNIVNDSDDDPDLDEDAGKIEAPAIHDDDQYSDEQTNLPDLPDVKPLASALARDRNSIDLSIDAVPVDRNIIDLVSDSD